MYERSYYIHCKLKFTVFFPSGSLNFRDYHLHLNEIICIFSICNLLFEKLGASDDSIARLYTVVNFAS